MALRAQDLMRKKVAVGTETTVKEAAHKMIATGLPGLPVVNEHMEVVGVVTEFNVLGAIREGMDLEKTSVGRLMTKQPATADIDTDCRDLIQMMLLDNYTIIPIVNNGKCAGVVSRLAVMDANLSARYSSITNRQQREALVYG